jgi:hypothetical protein
MNRQFTSPRTRLFSEHHREPADEHGSYAFITDPLRIRLPLEFTPEGVGDPSGVLVRYFSRGGDRGMRLFLLWQDDRPRETDPVWEDHIDYCIGREICEIVVRLWQPGPQTLELRFHTKCFNEVIVKKKRNITTVSLDRDKDVNFAFRRRGY